MVLFGFLVGCVDCFEFVLVGCFLLLSDVFINSVVLMFI